MKSLKSVKKDAWDAWEETNSRTGMVKLLTKRGYKVLGKGLFAVTLAPPDNDNHVIRCASFHHNSTRCKKVKGDAFPWYAQAIMNEWIRSSFAPKIYDMYQDGDTSITVVERCYPCRDRNIKERFRATAEVVTHGQKSGLLLTSLPFEKGPVRNFIEELRNYGKLDIGGTNIMKRKNGHIVLTDPIVED